MSAWARGAVLTSLVALWVGCAGSPVKGDAGARPARGGCECAADWKEGPPAAKPLSDEEIVGEPEGAGDSKEGAESGSP